MAERLLVVLSMQVPERAIRAIPSWDASLGELRAHLDVEIYSYPIDKKSPPERATWEAVVDELAVLMTPGTHVYAQASMLPLIAVRRAPGHVRSLIQHQTNFTPATLRAAGHLRLADAILGLVRGSTDISPRYTARNQLRQTFPDIGEEGTARLAELMSREYELDRFLKLMDSLSSLNLFEEAVPIDLPAQLWLSDVGIAGSAESSEIFTHFVPNAEVVEVPLLRFNDRAGGVDYAQRLIDFVSKHTTAPARLPESQGHR
jgi:hypothetical protein